MKSTKVADRLKGITFPRRFEMEGIDPLTVKCKVVHCVEGRLFENMYDSVEMASYIVCLSTLCGPMADKDRDGNWCVRFESKKAYKALSD